MGREQKITLKNQPQELIARSGDFELLPDNQNPPIITTQPSESFAQTTWIRQIVNNQPVYQTINPANQVYTMFSRTSISWKVSAFDPTNADNDNLVYVWKKDGTVLFEYNSLNNNSGTDTITISSAKCTPEISGEYICEVFNAFGSVESQPIQILVIDELNNSIFYKNLVVNGNGDGGTNDWTANTDITIKPFAKDSVRANRNFGSFYSLEFPVKELEGTPDTYPNSTRQQEFYFSQAGHFSLFYPLWYKAKTRNPELLNIQNNAITMDTVGLESWESWIAQGYPAQIVLNEDVIASGQYAGFFPGLYWMDQYNRNLSGNSIGLFDESANQVLMYFTRDKIKFSKFGGTQTTQMSQTVDLSQYADLINGNAFGIDHVSSQFFSYIGAGITRYQIKVTTESGTEATYNWLVQGSESYIYHVVNGNPFNIKLKPGTPIEIIPIVDDTTNVTIEYLNSFGEVLKTDLIQGPDETDVFAIKEKVYLPLSLYPVLQNFAGDFLNLREQADFLFGWPTINIESLIYRYYGNYENYINSAIFREFTIPEKRQDFYKTLLGNLSGNSRLDLAINNDTLNNVRANLSVSDVLEYINPSNTYYWGSVDSKDEVYGYITRSFAPSAISASFANSRAITPTIDLNAPLPVDFINTNLVNGTLLRTDIGYEITDDLIVNLLNRTNASNPITIFGQKYTDLNAIRAAKLDEGTAEDLYLATDRNGRFLQKKYNFKKYGATVPSGEYIKDELNRDRAVVEFGASAMFGVEKTTIIPKNTVSARITVSFTHKSNIPLDTQPEFKGWSNQEIYTNLYGEYPLNSERVVEYGNPRCGITKIKFLIAPNKPTISNNKVTYFLPPSNNTVLGLQKNLLFQDVHNTSQAGNFTYDLIQPQNLPTPPTFDSNPLINENELNNLQNSSTSLATSIDRVVRVASSESRG